jgi:hypothetical protein
MRESSGCPKEWKPTSQLLQKLIIAELLSGIYAGVGTDRLSRRHKLAANKGNRTDEGGLETETSFSCHAIPDRIHPPPHLLFEHLLVNHPSQLHIEMVGDKFRLHSPLILEHPAP